MVARTYGSHRVYEVIYEEDAADVSLQSTPKSDRKPLSEKPTGENEKAPVALSLKSKQKKATNKTKLRDQKLLGPEILEDEHATSNSSAVQEARRELIALYKDDNFVAPYLDRRPQTPPSKAVRAARRRLSRTPPDAQSPSPGAKRSAQEDISVLTVRGSPFDEIEITIREVMEEDDTSTNHSPAASISPITSSPSRSSPRIEDRVEAIDSLVEALEELETAIPIVLEDVKTVSFKAAPESPAPKAIANTTKKRVASAPVRKNHSTVPQQPTKPAMKPNFNINGTIKSITPRTSMAATTGSANRRTSMPVGRTPITPATQKMPAPRVASIAKTPFVPVKSTKAPTRPAFTLPGDAIAAKKRAQLEARLKREEEERIAKRQFKARPVPSRTSIGAVESSKTSQKSDGQAKTPARTSTQVKAVKNNTTRTPASINTKQFARAPTQAPVQAKTAQKPVARPIANATTKQSALKPASTMNAPVRPSRQPMPRTTKPASTPTNKISPITPARPPIRSTPRPAPAKSAIKPTQTPASSSVTPTKLMTPQEKMAAAKKARSEAAERGRQASREWAETQRKKRASLPAPTTKQT